MTTAAINTFKADLATLKFTLFEHIGAQEVLSQPRFSHLAREDAEAMIAETHKFACDVVGPLNRPGDLSGCKLENGRVQTPVGYKEAWQQLYELGIPSFTASQDWEGLGGPAVIYAAMVELLHGANISLIMYPELTLAAAEVIDHFCLPETKKRFMAPMLAGRYSGTMCISEPDAGSDVGAARTKATPRDDGTHAIAGTKCWISCGDNDFTENTVHLVLARIEGAKSGTKGLSMFIVPRVWVNEDGALGEDNDVQVSAIEHKLGVNSSATCTLNFGENGKCRGILVGNAPHQGIKQMFLMMNMARIAVGLQAIGIASTAYLNALEYARERKQGPSIKEFKDPTAPKVPIIEHSDVRRMLIEMKGMVEGLRALVLKLAYHHDMSAALADSDETKAAYHSGWVDLLTPVVKAYSSDQAFRVCETAVQVYAGAGYVQDNPVEQHLRDAKILSIYEGTNHIQALDLVARKLRRAQGQNLMTFLGEVQAFAEEHAEHPRLGDHMKRLDTAREALGNGAFKLMEFAMSDQLELVTLNANAFLEAMGELAVGWMLLQAAAVASKVLADGASGAANGKEFYEGKILTATHFANTFLPGVETKIAALQRADKSALDIPDAGF